MNARPTAGARLVQPLPCIFTAILLELAPKHGDPRGVRGDHLHAWFLTQVKDRDPSLADRLHTDTRHKPLALWVGPRFALGPHGVTRDTSDDRYWLRIASLDADLTALIPSIVASRTVVLGPAEFTPVCALSDPADHQWVGSEPAPVLWDHWMRDADPSSPGCRASVAPRAARRPAGKARRLRISGIFEGGATPPGGMHRRSNAAGLAPRAATGHIRLRFISPTGFSRDRHSVRLFPTGELVFRSLIEIWNDHARPAIDDDLANALLASVREERHEIRTVPPVSFGESRVKGFIGTCEYSVDSAGQPAVERLLHLLADFAFYSGVGLKRGMGMGQVLGETA